MRKNTVRRGAITGGVAGVAIIAALLAPAVANAAEPGAPAVEVAEPSVAAVAEPSIAEVAGPEVVQPGVGIQIDPSGPNDIYTTDDPSQTVIITQDRDGHGTVTRVHPGPPPGAVPAIPLQPGQPGVVIAPRDSIPAMPIVPALPAPSTGSAG
ncbi:hypothetical protein GFY24_15665 [Nocardia sp. SYP-A9097]|uniref:hypothetical protein n=1 Tax=Nocardia sp. SYP-A9097 TaxID=2663237 RepID=UPI00129B8EA6|nr:hypothetical protein [Nocardia sp. SYP-A9097]MRH88866.1 hypothetical protein [Nocardia sp. SYP-A9097]